MDTRNFILRAAVISLFIASQGCSKQVAEDAPLRPVRFIEVNESSTDFSGTYPGISTAGVEMNLSFRVSSTLVDFDARLGQKVVKGAQLAALDDSDASLIYDKERVNLKNMEVRLDTAKSNLSRIKGLYENNNIALSEYESAKDGHSNAKAAFESQKRVVSLRKRELSYYKIQAPIDGIISAIFVEENEQVKTGDVILTLQTVGNIEVSVGMPEQLIPQISEGQNVSVLFPSFPDKPFKGKVVEVSYAANEESSTYPVTIALLRKSSDLRPGMPASVTFNFPVDESSHLLRVPVHAVTEGVNGNYLFTMTVSEEGYGIVHNRPVSVGQLTNDGLEITKGLKRGENVVTAGIGLLSDGMKVKLLK